MQLIASNTSWGRWACAVSVQELPELPWDVLERVLPLLPARALLRALAVHAGVLRASLETWLGSLTQLWVV